MYNMFEFTHTSVYYVEMETYCNWWAPKFHLAHIDKYWLYAKFATWQILTSCRLQLEEKHISLLYNDSFIWFIRLLDIFNNVFFFFLQKVVCDEAEDNQTHVPLLTTHEFVPKTSLKSATFLSKMPMESQMLPSHKDINYTDRHTECDMNKQCSMEKDSIPSSSQQSKVCFKSPVALNSDAVFSEQPWWPVHSDLFMSFIIFNFWVKNNSFSLKGEYGRIVKAGWNVCRLTTVKFSLHFNVFLAKFFIYIVFYY